MSGARYLPLLVFEIILAGLFFFFVKYDGANESLIRGYEDTHVMIYIGFGFLMTFLKKYCYGALGINWLLAALVAQWSIITQGVFNLEEMKIPLNKKMILEADIMSATVLITYGALLGRATVGQLLVIAIIEAAVGSANLYLLESVLEVADVGGAIAIHAYGAFFGLGVSASWIQRKTRGGAPSDQQQQQNQPHQEHGGHPLEGPNYISDVTSMIGSIFLFVYWPSFNAALTNSIVDYQRAIVNSYLSLTACSVVTFVLSALLKHGKFEMEHVQNSTLAGGVGVGSICNMHISAGAAILVGIGAAFISVFGFTKVKVARNVIKLAYEFSPRLNGHISTGAAIFIGSGGAFISVTGFTKLKPFLIKKFGLLDTCGVMHLHGFPGVYSGLLSVLFAAMATEETYTKIGLHSVFEAMEHGRTASTQALYQLMALVITIAVGFIAGVITGCITNLSIFAPLKKDDQFNDDVFWEVP